MAGNSKSREDISEYDFNVVSHFFTWEKTHKPYWAYSNARIVRVVKGEGDWSINGKLYHVTAGDIVILSSVDFRRMEPLLLGNTLEMIDLQILPPRLYAPEMTVFYIRLPGFSNVLPRDHHYFEPLSALLMRIIDSLRADGRRPGEEFIGTAWSQICGYLREMYMPFLREVTVRQNQLLMETCRYIAANIGKDLSCNLLAKAMYCTPEHLSRTFHRLSGMLLSDYIRRIRVQTVLRKLYESNITVLNAALTCGFRSASGFYKAFKAETGMSPMEYMRM